MSSNGVQKPGVTAMPGCHRLHRIGPARAMTDQTRLRKT